MKSDVRVSTRAYEEWLGKQLRGQLVEKDLEEKHKKMNSGPFLFFRATYWRWAEIIQGGDLEIIADAPPAPAVGDIHLENYGVWRDQDGRLVWGVNDFDEATEMPYVCDLLRLAVSAALAPVGWSANIPNLCASLLRGYRDGLKEPGAFILDRDNAWLRQQFEVDNGERAEFWAKIEKKRRKAEKAKNGYGKNGKKKGNSEVNEPPDAYREALIASLPRGSSEPDFWPSDAGTGSLGRPRWVAYAEWRGAPVIREAKAVAPSAWTYAAGDNTRAIYSAEIASGRFRAPDPCYRVSNGIVLRRLSPNSRKLEVESCGAVLLDPRMLGLMGHELANIHLGGDSNPVKLADSIKDHLKAHQPEPFVTGVTDLTDRMIKEQAEFAEAA